MLKSIFIPLMFCLLLYGAWLALSAGSYKDKFEKAKDWNTVEGRIVNRDEGVDFNMLNPVTYPKLLVCDPSITYSYTVNNQRYVNVDKLPLCLVFVRLATRGDYDPNAVAEEQEADFETMMNESMALHRKNPRQKDDMSKHIYYDKEKGVQLRGLGSMIKNAMPTEEEMDVFRPRIQVKYRAGNPEEAVTAKDEIKGYECMFQSGIWMIIIAILSSAAVFFHRWVTKPSEEDLNMQFQGRSAIKY